MTTVPNLRAIPPTTGATGRSEAREQQDSRDRDRRSSRPRDDRRGSSSRPYYLDRPSHTTSSTANAKDRSSRGRRASDRDAAIDDLNDSFPRLELKRRESGRKGGRRHEFRYYEPTQPEPESSSSRRSRRPRSLDRRAADRPSERSSRRMSTTDGPSRRRESRRRRRDSDYDDDDDDSDYDRAPSRRRRSSRDDTAGSKKRAVATNLGKAAIAAGALEAVRQKRPGASNRESGVAWKRVATAALGGAAIDAAAAKVRGVDPRERRGSAKKAFMGASLGGLVVEGLVNRLKP